MITFYQSEKGIGLDEMPKKFVFRKVQLYLEGVFIGFANSTNRIIDLGGYVKKFTESELKRITYKEIENE